MAGNGADTAIPLGQVFAQVPEIGSLLAGLGDDAVRTSPRSMASTSSASSAAATGRPSQADLDQHRPWHAGQRLADFGQHLGQKGQPCPRSSNAVTPPAMRPRPAPAGQAPPRGRGPQHGDAGLRRRHDKAQAGGGDDPQRALGPDQQVAQVIAGIVPAAA